MQLDAAVEASFGSHLLPCAMLSRTGIALSLEQVYLIISKDHTQCSLVQNVISAQCSESITCSDATSFLQDHSLTSTGLRPHACDLSRLLNAKSFDVAEEHSGIEFDTTALGSSWRFRITSANQPAALDSSEAFPKPRTRAIGLLVPNACCRGALLHCIIVQSFSPNQNIH